MKRPERKSSITPSLADTARRSDCHHQVREIEVVKHDIADKDHWTWTDSSPPTTARHCSSTRASTFNEIEDDLAASDEDDVIFYNAPRLTNDRVRAFLVDYYEDFNSIAPQKVRECWKAFYSRHYTPNYRKVRSSGNSISAEGLIDLYMSNDLQLREMILVSVDSIQIVAGGLVAVAVYTADQRFEYKGICNHDRTVYSVVVEEINGEPKIVLEQRTTGVPIPRESRWKNSDQETDSVRIHESTASHNTTTAAAAAVVDPLSSSSRSGGSASNKSPSTGAPRPPPHHSESQSDFEFTADEEDSEEEEEEDDPSNQLQRPAFEDSCRPVVEAAKSPPARRKSSNINTTTTSRTTEAFGRRRI
jgi:hypothetical protein